MDNKNTEIIKPANPGSPNEDIQLLYDFKMKVITESIGNLVKVLPVYLTILAVLIGFFFSQDTSYETKKYLVFIGVTASISVIAIYSIITNSVILCFKSIGKLLEKNNASLFQELKINRSIKKVKTSVVLVLIIISIFALILAIGLWLYLKK